MKHPARRDGRRRNPHSRELRPEKLHIEIIAGFLKYLRAALHLRDGLRASNRRHERTEIRRAAANVRNDDNPAPPLSGRVCRNRCCFSRTEALPFFVRNMLLLASARFSAFSNAWSASLCGRPPPFERAPPVRPPAETCNDKVTLSPSFCPVSCPRRGVQAARARAKAAPAPWRGLLPAQADVL